MEKRSWKLKNEVCLVDDRDVVIYLSVLDSSSSSIFSFTVQIHIAYRDLP